MYEAVLSCWLPPQMKKDSPVLTRDLNIASRSTHTNNISSIEFKLKYCEMKHEIMCSGFTIDVQNYLYNKNRIIKILMIFLLKKVYTQLIMDMNNIWLCAVDWCRNRFFLHMCKPIWPHPYILIRAHRDKIWRVRKVRCEVKSHSVFQNVSIESLKLLIYRNRRKHHSILVYYV